MNESRASFQRQLKSLLILLAIMFCLSTTIGGTPALAADSYDITILGGSAGGLWSIITEGVAETIRRSWPEARITTEPGKDGPNQVMIARNEVQFAVVNEGTTVAALRGQFPYKAELKNLRAVAVLNPTSTFQFILNEKTGVKSIKDIKDKKLPLRVAVNRQGTLMHVSSKVVLEAYGITYDDIQSWGGKVHLIPGPQAMDLWDAGQLDAIVEFSQYPSSRFIEHAKKHDLVILPIDQDKLPDLCEKLGVTATVMPAHSYPFQPEDCPTIGTKLLLITNAEQPDEVVYNVLKAMNENLDYLHKVHANLKDLDSLEMAKDLLIDLHPGAIKFYREVGVMK